jgi:NTE family protein
LAAPHSGLGWVPGLYPPKIYNGTLHVDGGVLDNLPVTALEGREGPLVAVSIGSGGEARPTSMTQHARSLRMPGIGDTLMRTMTIGSGMASAAVMARADLVIQPDTNGIGFLEFHQIDRAREAGRIAAREALPQIIALAHR